MEAHKLASLAGTVTMVVFGAAHYAEPMLEVQAGTPAQQPATRPALPRPQSPNQPATQVPTPPTGPVTTAPGATAPPATATPPTAPPGAVQPATTTPGTGFAPTTGGFFAFQNPAGQLQFQQVANQLLTSEQQLNDTNTRLLRQLGQARQMTGERRFDALSEVLQGELQQQQALLQHLENLRATLTGQVANGTTPSNPGTMTPKPPRATNPSAPANNPTIPR